MGFLVHIKSAVGVPEVEAVSLFGGGVSIPYRISLLHIVSGITRVVGRRCIEVIFADVGAVVSVLAIQVADGGHIVAE